MGCYCFLVLSNNNKLLLTNKIKREKILCNNLDLTELNIPQVDNASLFVLENDDYNIKEKAKKILGTDEKSWLVFNKYGESLTSDVYASLDESDLNHIKLIHDLTNQTNKVMANVHTDRYFYGNVNQKLFVKCTIKNPLDIEIQVSSVKLFCQYVPNKISPNQTQDQAPNSTQTNNENKANMENNENSQNQTPETNTISGDTRNSLEKNININDKINNNDNSIQDDNNNVNKKEEQSKGQDTEQQQLSYSISEDSYNMSPGQVIELELNVSSPLEGKIIVKGLEFLLFNECKKKIILRK